MRDSRMRVGRCRLLATACWTSLLVILGSQATARADYPSPLAPSSPSQTQIPIPPSPGASPPQAGARLPASDGAPLLRPDAQVLLIDLPTALRVANAGNPTIGVARARLQEAYARLRQAQVMWLPNL